MDYTELNNIWDYYLSLEEDLARTSQYVEPAGQENVYSFEFAKILILACTEVESVFKRLCFELTHEKLGTMSQYKETILANYPKIVDANVYVSRFGCTIYPFAKWETKKLSWWDAYQGVKHSRATSFHDATYLNAVFSLSALYILIFYLAKNLNIDFRGIGSKYIYSQYSGKFYTTAPDKQLPDFEISPK